MKKIFSLSDDEKRNSTIACIQPGGVLEKLDLISTWIDSENPLPFKLQLNESNRKGSKNIPSAKYIDYQSNNLALPLMSERFFMLIKPYLGKEEILWIKIIVTGKDDERMYYIPRFLQVFDVLDLENSTFASSGYPLKTVFSESKIADFNFICIQRTFSRGLTLRIFCSDDIRKVICDNKLTGMEFEQKVVSSN